MRVLSIFYYFAITNKKNFREGLETLHFNFFNIIKDHKIEIYKNCIYLNKYTLRELIQRLSITKINDKQIISMLRDLNKVSIQFREYESRNSEFVKMYLTRIITAENEKIKEHYTYTLLSESKKTTIHATSNMPQKLTPMQIADLPIPELILPKASNPGSVITLHPKKLFLSDKYKLVSGYHIDAIKFNHMTLFDLNNENYKYIYEKHDTFSKILLHYLNIVDKEFVHELTSDCFEHILIDLDQNDIIFITKSILNITNKDNILSNFDSKNNP